MKFSKEQKSQFVFAASNGRWKTVQEQLDAGMPVDAKDGKRTALYEAISLKHWKVVEILLNAGADVLLKRSPRAWTNLHNAAMAGNADLVAQLIGLGAEVDDQNNQDHWSPLHLATNTSCVTALLDAGADPNAVDKRGIPVVQSVVSYTHDGIFESVRALRDAGAQWPKEPGLVLLNAFALTPNGGQLAYRLVKELDLPTDWVFENRNALMCAVDADARELVAHLLDHGADPNEVCGKWNYLPIQSASHADRYEIAELLLAQGADPHKEHAGHTAYKLAATDRMKALLAGTELPEPDPVDEYVRHVTAGYVNKAMPFADTLPVDTMIEEEGSDRMPILLWSVMFDAGACVQRLLERGADFNVTTNEAGSTPLHLACMAENHRYIKWLLEAGADPNARDVNNAKPQDYASDKVRKIVKQYTPK